MNLNHPEVKELISSWQNELREKTGNSVVLLTTYIPSSKITLPELKRIICEYVGVAPDQVVHSSRYAKQVLARHLIAFYAREHFGYSFSEIADELNRKDHTTILKNIRKVKSYIEIGDKSICYLISAINAEMEKYK
jgi:chromosomal replication initiator protein